AQFASEEAVIKIGTAIDTSLGEYIKVTVVATGMGSPVTASIKPAIRIIPNKNSIGELDYDALDKPTHLRTGRMDARETRFGAQPKKEGDLDYLDVPSFLRRQAD
ncbi:MAG: cell division protein FtsZ, partial [Methylococcales bacterium]|nr:cell division protein FtsZ [Methylococcales bacterium]